VQRLQRAVTALRDDVDRELGRRLSNGMETLLLKADAAALQKDGRPWGSLPR